MPANTPATPTSGNMIKALNALGTLKAPERWSALTAIAVNHPEIMLAIVAEVQAGRAAE